MLQCMRLLDIQTLNTDDKDMRIKNTTYTYTTCQDNNTDQHTLVYKFTI